MWIETEDAHMKIVNLANANEVTIIYSGAHGYKVVANMIGGTDVFIKKFTNEREATEYVKELLTELT
jgi:hypothetical protein